MFYHTDLYHDLSLHRTCLGDEFIEALKQKVTCDVEGTCIDDHGSVIAVTFLDSIVDANFHLLKEDYIIYKLKFKAIVFRPFKNEVLDGIVIQVNKLGLFLKVGIMTCFISEKSIPCTMQYNGRIYQSSKDKTHVIDVSTPLRFRILGTRVDSSEIFAVGTLMNEYLGLLNHQLTR